MKPLFLLKTVFLFLVACSNNDKNNSQSIMQHFFCKINNVDFNPQFKSGVSLSTSTVILLTGENNNGKIVQLTVPKNITPGVYTVTNNDPSVLGIYMQHTRSDNDGDFAMATDATLTIISHNQTTKTIKGTFSFTGRILNDNALITVSDGSFEIKYMQTQ